MPREKDVSFRLSLINHFDRNVVVDSSGISELALAVVAPAVDNPQHLGTAAAVKPASAD